MSKRLSPASDDDSPVPSVDEPHFRKRRLVDFEPLRICSVSSTCEIDAKVLAVQHYKLSERFRFEERQRAKLQQRVEQLESRQTQDDAIMCTINRFWNRFDDNVRLLLQRFDAETALEDEIKMECEETKNFLAKLAHWDGEDIEEKLKQRVEFSRRAIAKLVQVFDHITQRNDKIAELIASSAVADESTNEGASTSFDEKHSINLQVARRNQELSEENKRLQKLVTKLQCENHGLSMKVSAQEDELTIMETRKEEMSNSLEDAKYELEKSVRREVKLDCRLAEYVRKTQELEKEFLKAATTSNGPSTANSNNDTSNTTTVNKSRLEELETDLELQKELANSRLEELHEMLEKNKSLVRQLDSLKMNLKNIPTEVIRTSLEYTTLQSQFSALYNEANSMRLQLDVAKSQLITLRTAHAKEIDVMESEECQAREQMQDAMSKHEEELHQLRREYEMLRLEFEQNLSANEQSGPVNKEIRLMLASAKAENQQLKQEVNRFKRKWKEAVSSLAKSNKELEGERRYRERCIWIEIDDDGDTLASPDQERNSVISGDSLLHDGSSRESNNDIDMDNDVNLHPSRVIQKLKKKIADLQLKLDVINSLCGEKRERAEILIRERRLKVENERLQAHIRRLAGADHRDKTRYYSEDAQRKIRSLEETNERLRKEAHSARQEEEGLMNDVETTGQAFEEMQEQNTRLLQQLKEKDDANLKLMAERIRANQYQKKMGEERDRTEERLNSLQNQIEAQQLMISKLEETEKMLRQKNSQMEHQLRMIEQANEMHKRKAIECSQTSADYKAQLEKCNSQLNDAQQAVTMKTAQQEVDTYKIKRLEEERSLLRKKLERAKKMETVESLDEVLNAEIKELKGLLTCPSCKVRQKDAVLTKCFHVFCMECMKTRYETRRRKCPRCNAAFGANDYRRMYFT